MGRNGEKWDKEDMKKKRWEIWKRERIVVEID